jgi:uncharacterized protein YkwD
MGRFVMVAGLMILPALGASWSLQSVRPAGAVVTTPRPSAVAKVLGASTPGPAMSALPTVPATPTPPPARPAPQSASRGGAAATTPAVAPDIASEAACPGQSDSNQAAAVLTCMTSFARRYHGLDGVSSQTALMAAANAKAQDMVTCGYGHTACGRAFDYWITAKGFDGHCSAENIAQGQQSPRAVFGAWMGSAGHRANILDPDYRFIGIGATTSADGPDWVMQLGGC